MVVISALAEIGFPGLTDYVGSLPAAERSQALADLDSLQRKRYGAGLSRINEEPVPAVRYDYQGEDLEDIAREMAQAPSRSRG